MLYVTTRSDRDAFTVQRVLTENRGSDGGLYVPFRLPRLTEEQIGSLGEKSFSRSAAEMLNLLFNTRLTSWDVDFAIGRHGVCLRQLNQRILVGELWHNPSDCFEGLAKLLSQLVRGSKEGACSNWLKVGIRIAVLYGLFSEMIRLGLVSMDKPVDIACVSGDFSGPVSAWYLRQMGLPVGNIICCCNENANLWDFICHGQLRTDAVSLVTATPEADIQLPENLERLICGCAGREEVLRFVSASRIGSNYYLEDRTLQNLRKGIYVTVTSSHRILASIPAVYKTHAYLLSSYGALAYSGLQDYRARTGANGYALVLTEHSPLLDRKLTAKALGIQEESLEDYI